MTEPDTTGQRIDHAAQAAVGTDESSASPPAPTDPAAGPGDGSPGSDGAVGDQADVPATEGNRQLVETVRSIERLEESN